MKEQTIERLQANDRALMANALRLASDVYLSMAKDHQNMQREFLDYSQRCRLMSDDVFDCDDVQLVNEES